MNLLVTMDTNETQGAPVGSGDVTPSPDTASHVTHEDGTTQGDNVSREGQPSEKLAGKYSSPQELEKAYKELESKMGSLGQKAAVADLLQEKFGVTPEQLRQRIEQQELQRKQELYAQNPLAPLVDEVQELRQWKQQQEVERAQAAVKSEVEAFVKENPAYEGQKDNLMKLALTPGIGFTENGEVPLSELAGQFFGSAMAQAQQAAYQKIEMKQNTQATPTSKSAQKQAQGYESLKDLPLSERLRTFESLMQ